MDEQLRDALSKPFGREAIRQKRGQGGRTMDYVSHGMITKRLNDVAPDWTAEMIERYVQDSNGTLHCHGGVMRMTIGGVTHEEAGGPARLSSLADDLKNTYSDCLKRCAMRFGVALDLWESADENDEDAEPAARQHTPQIVSYQETGDHLQAQGFRYQPRTDSAREAAAQGSAKASEKQVKFIHAIAREAGLSEPELAAWCQELYSQDVDDLNRRDASALIEALQRRRNEIA